MEPFGENVSSGASFEIKTSKHFLFSFWTSCLLWKVCVLSICLRLPFLPAVVCPIKNGPLAPWGVYQNYYTGAEISSYVFHVPTSISPRRCGKHHSQQCAGWSPAIVRRTENMQEVGQRKMKDTHEGIVMPAFISTDIEAQRGYDPLGVIWLVPTEWSSILQRSPIQSSLQTLLKAKSYIQCWWSPVITSSHQH